MSVDVSDYADPKQDNESATVETITKYPQIFQDFVTRHDGRNVNSLGDDVLAEYPSPIEAIQQSIEIQRDLGWRNRQLADHRQVRFGIGVNLGDVIPQDDGSLYGDGVNIATRLEGLAEPRGICTSEI